MVDGPGWQIPIRRIGWWLLLCPPIGWLMALGYRLDVVIGLRRPPTVTPSKRLPGFRSDLWYFWQGFAALAVMTLYLVPPLVLFWLSLHGASVGGFQLANLADPALWLFVAAVMFFVPVTIWLVPAVVFFTTPNAWAHFFPCAISVVLLILAVFFVPSGYMQIGDRGRFSDALRVWRGIPWVLTHLRTYLHAWRESGQISMVAFLLGWRAPWGIVWSYAGIVWHFNIEFMSPDHPAHYKQAPDAFEKYLERLETSGVRVIYRLGRPVPVFWDEPTNLEKPRS
jgi:Protein of unknown function (DUF4013)